VIAALGWTLAAAVAAGAAFFLFQAFKYTRVIGNIFSSLVYRPDAEPPTAAAGEPLTILDSSDKEIPALLVRAKAPVRAVIFCHESGSTKESWENYAGFLPRRGCHVLSVDFARESADRPNSLAQWPTAGDVARLLVAVRWAKREFGAGMPIVLFGVSNGADIAFAASFGDAAVKGVVADGLFSMREIFRAYIRRWAPILVKPNLFGERYPEWIVNLFSALGFWHSQRLAGTRFVDVEALLRRRHAPLLMIHGEADEYVPEAHQRFLRAAAGDGPSVRAMQVPRAGHNQAIAVDRTGYESAVAGFLEAL
jgi:pimeloyl-ACP methyl ester carboxylesterase